MLARFFSGWPSGIVSRVDNLSALIQNVTQALFGPLLSFRAVEDGAEIGGGEGLGGFELGLGSGAGVVHSGHLLVEEGGDAFLLGKGRDKKLYQIKLRETQVLYICTSGLVNDGKVDIASFSPISVRNFSIFLSP